MRSLILFFIFTQFMFAQNYNVSSFQKINELNGGFIGGLNNQDNLGVSIDGIGDLDGNGVNDLAVGAFSDDDGGINRGAVWILFLDSNDFVINQTKISDTSGGFNGVIDNEDRFGGAVAYLGDLNSDGLIELAVGADYDGDGGFWHGAVWILSLNPDGTVNSHAKISDTQGAFNGFINGDAIFGTDIENIGDLNGDGIEDLAVGSRRDNDGGNSGGALWILFMNSDFTVNNSQKISSTAGNFGLNLGFEDYFGGSVVNIGDLNGDGVVDLAVGSYRDDDQLNNAGSFYVLFLNSDGTVNSHQKISNLSGGLNSNITSGALFGESIDGIVDIDNDGKVEVVVGAMKQVNPTLSQETGGFFIIELNSDGTVSEEFFYSYAENCFSGNLTNGDLFGGSVCLLNTDSNNFKIGVGAYRDSENGSQKGAAWILNLGEISFDLQSFSNPSGCGTQDGSFSISGLNSNSEYTITYNNGSPQTITLFSNASGEITISSLDAGVYDNILVTETLTGCNDNLAQVELIATGLMANITFTNPSGCGSDDGTIVITGLNPNSNHTFDYTYEGNLESISLVSDSNGTVTISNLTAGIYSAIIITEEATSCSDDIGQVELMTISLSATITSTNPSDCGIDDGVIVISDLNGNSTYTITYDFEGTLVTLSEVSDASGTITLSNFANGNYTSITITEDATSCTDNLGEVEMASNPLSASITSTNPSDCGIDDGVIVISDLNGNSTYTITYDFEGTLVTLSEVSDASGTITLSNLANGNYTSITITEDATSCTDNLGEVEMASNLLSASITSTNPSGCDSEDGTITITNISPNTEYTLTYNDGLDQSITQMSNTSGEFVVTGLSSGTYDFIVITESISGCVDNLEQIVLNSSNFEAGISAISPTNCDLSDGTIFIFNLTPNTEYTLTYNDGSNQSITQTSDDNGFFVVSDLSTGLYSDIMMLDIANNCTADLGIIELDCITTFDCFETKLFFTPNGDGYNDYWHLVSPSNECKYILYIFDRYGKLLRTLTPNDSKWDGTYNGAIMPSNDYWYLVKYRNFEGADLEFRSHFSLKR
ncbi:T9SS type B sorting domain-containing protein [Psychroserpens sp. AS72]|uniref:T9SS type B sorting domain-containing protein n=1 Tax=Psychroserpens sp. AS72 TaxID=3135775 RepID=UPI00317180C5